MTVDDVSVVTVPRKLFEELVAEAPTFRQVIFDLMNARMGILMRLVHEVAFLRLDRRLASLLIERAAAAAEPVVASTHQKLAEDLGTSREIVSRILESFEAQGFVRLGRGKIRLADVPEIRRQYLD